MQRGFLFYNGPDKLESEYELKLSDSYIDNINGNNLSLELRVKVININSEAGSEVLEKCLILREYTQFVEKVRELKNKGNTDYMKDAIEYCISHHILEEYLKRKGSDVMGFLCAEYDYEMDMQVKGEEKYEEGLEQGIQQGISLTIKNVLKKLTIDDVVELGYDRELVERIANGN